MRGKDKEPASSVAGVSLCRYISVNEVESTEESPNHQLRLAFVTAAYCLSQNWRRQGLGNIVALIAADTAEYGK